MADTSRSAVPACQKASGNVTGRLRLSTSGWDIHFGWGKAWTLRETARYFGHSLDDLREVVLFWLWRGK